MASQIINFGKQFTNVSTKDDTNEITRKMHELKADTSNDIYHSAARLQSMMEKGATKDDTNEITRSLHELQAVTSSKILQTEASLQSRIEKGATKDDTNEITRNMQEMRASTSSAINQSTARLESIIRKEGAQHKNELVSISREKESNLPSSNIPETRPIAGRQDYLDVLREKLESKVVVISGAPGMGKSTLAWTFAKQEMDANPSQICLNASFKELSSDLDETLVKPNAVRLLCQLFPAITQAVNDSPDPLQILFAHIKDIVQSKNLLIILDNIDTLLGKFRQYGIVNEIINKIFVTGVRVICTSRDKSYDLELNQSLFETQDLKPLEAEDCKKWLQKLHSELDDELIQEIVRSSGGVPLVLKILAALVQRIDDITVTELRQLKSSQGFITLEGSLLLSFEKLTKEQSLLMNCASIFLDSFDKKTISCIFRDYSQSKLDGIILLIDCQGLSLVEYDKCSKLFYLHPFIKDYVRLKISDFAKLELVYIRNYFDKLLHWSLAQVEKNNFGPTLDSVRRDWHNLKQFIASFRNLDLAATDLNDVFPVSWSGQLCFAILACFSFLRILSSFRTLLLPFAEKLEAIMAELKEHNALIVCKCIISSELRRKKVVGNINKSRNILNKSREIVADDTSLNTSLARGFLYYTIGRSIRYTSFGKNVKPTYSFDWEEWPIADCYETTVEMYEKILTSSDAWVVEYWPIILCEKTRTLTELRRAQLDAITDKNDKPDKLKSIISKHLAFKDDLTETLGNHESVAYTTRKLADRVKFNIKDQKEASLLYEKSHQIYTSFGSEMSIQTAIVLKEWSGCCSNDEAIAKLREAKKIMEDNYMTYHSDYFAIRKRLEEKLAEVVTSKANGGI